MAEKTLAAAYFPFRTLLNLIERMEANGPPLLIDRSYLTGSGAANTQFLAGLKSLGLIDEKGALQPPLIELVSQPKSRSSLIRAMVERVYPEPVRLGKLNGTQSQLENAFSEFHGVSGVTRRKAIAFFLSAAKYANLAVSPNFKPQKASPGPSSGTGSAKAGAKRQKAQKPKKRDSGSAVTPPPDGESLGGMKERYFAMLMDRAKEGGDAELFDRIERLLGLEGGEG